MFRIDSATAAGDAGHASNDCGCFNRGVEEGQRVASGDDPISVEMMNAMGGKYAVAAKEENLTRIEPCQIAAPHVEDIAWQDSREHAGPRNLEANLTGACSHVVDKLAANGML